MQMGLERWWLASYGRVSNVLQQLWAASEHVAMKSSSRTLGSQHLHTSIVESPTHTHKHIHAVLAKLRSILKPAQQIDLSDRKWGVVRCSNSPLPMRLQWEHSGKFNVLNKGVSFVYCVIRFSIVSLFSPHHKYFEGISCFLHVYMHVTMKTVKILPVLFLIHEVFLLPERIKIGKSTTLNFDLCPIYHQPFATNHQYFNIIPEESIWLEALGNLISQALYILYRQKYIYCSISNGLGLLVIFQISTF